MTSVLVRSFVLLMACAPGCNGAACANESCNLSAVATDAPSMLQMSSRSRHNGTGRTKNSSLLGDVNVESWNQIGYNIKLLNWKIGETDYSKIGASIYAGFGAMQLASDLIHGGGDPLGSVVTATKAFVPLVGMINPALGLVAGMFLGLFSVGENKAEQLNALFEQIMEAVQKMITSTMVTDTLLDQQVALAKIISRLNDHPFYVQEPQVADSANENYDGARFAFWLDMEGLVDQGISDVFSKYCIKLPVYGTLFPECSDMCQGFSANGNFVAQVQYATFHLQTFQELARLTTNTSKGFIDAGLSKKDLYAQLLTASFTWLLQYRTTLPCEFQYKNGDCHDIILTEAAAAPDPYVGITVPDYTGCYSECFFGCDKKKLDEYCYVEPSYGGWDYCCHHTDYEKLNSDWRKNTTVLYSPWVRAFQIQFDSAINASGVACDCPPGSAYAYPNATNYSSCQLLCSQDVLCRAFQFDADADMVEPLNLSTMGVCTLNSCERVGSGGECRTSEDCQSGLVCSDGVCMTQEECFLSICDPEPAERTICTGNCYDVDVSTTPNCYGYETHYVCYGQMCAGCDPGDADICSTFQGYGTFDISRGTCTRVSGAGHVEEGNASKPQSKSRAAETSDATAGPRGLIANTTLVTSQAAQRLDADSAYCGGTCYSADTYISHCGGYEAAGYTCLNYACAGCNVGGTPDTCADRHGDGTWLISGGYCSKVKCKGIIGGYVPTDRCYQSPNHLDNGAACTNSDQCSVLDNYCRVGDRRCLTDAQCTTGDCTKILDGPLQTFANMSRQFCIEFKKNATFPTTDYDECRSLCGNGCNAFALGPDCVIIEACVPSVIWREQAYNYFMKDLTTVAAAKKERTFCSRATINDFLPKV